jgi:hypothetical protein
MYIVVSVRTIQLGICQLKPNLNEIAYYDNGIMKLNRMLNYINRFNGSWIISINELDFELNMGLLLLAGFSDRGRERIKS